MKVLITDEISDSGLLPLLEDPRIEVDKSWGCLSPSCMRLLVGTKQSLPAVGHWWIRPLSITPPT